MQVYLVGGAVRDAMLDIPVQDRDWVVVGATPEDMMALGCKQVGVDFPVFLHPETQEEYALARTERKSGQGYHGFDVNASTEVSLEQDLMRRDLTINAMAFTQSGQLVDPYGGQQDLQDRVLRHVSPAFVEDPLRVLRVARFMAQLSDFNFQLADETRALLSEMSLQGELDHLVPDRVWQEVSKALMTKRPSLFFLCLREVGALTVLFPELDKLFEVPQSPVDHPEGDAGIHTMMVLDAAARISDSLDVRFAALAHDLGKGLTQSSFWPKHPGHEQAGLALVNRWAQIYPLPKATHQLALRATEWHGWIHRGGLDMSPQDMLKVIKGCDALRQPERFEQLLLVCEADHYGRLGFENEDYKQKAFWLGALDVCRQVDAKALADSGLTGEKIAQAIEQQRLARLDNYKTRLISGKNTSGQNG